MTSTELNARDLLRAEVQVTPVQEIFDQDLKLARSIRKETVASDIIRYRREENSQGENGKRTPGPWELGVTEWPEVSIDELEEEAANLGGLAAKVRFGANRLEFSESTIELEDAVDLMYRGFAEAIETDVFNTYTNSRETSDGSEFDGNFDEGTGGYATNGDHILFTPDSGLEWDAGGDILRQLHDMKKAMRSQGRTQDLDGHVRLTDNMRAYMDSLTFSQFSEDLTVRGLDPQEGSIPQSIRVPAVQGIEFVQADFAIENDGDMLLVDEGNDPVVGYYHEYDRLNDMGFTTVENDSGYPLQVKDMDDEETGDALVQAAVGKVEVNRKPKYVLHARGLLS